MLIAITISTTSNNYFIAIATVPTKTNSAATTTDIRLLLVIRY